MEKFEMPKLKEVNQRNNNEFVTCIICMYSLNKKNKIKKYMLKGHHWFHLRAVIGQLIVFHSGIDGAFPFQKRRTFSAPLHSN